MIQTLFKAHSTGYWVWTATHDKGRATVRWGKENGKQQSLDCTSGEANMRYRKKLDQGYSLTKQPQTVQPMLALKLSDNPTLPQTVVYQPKLDGYRALMSNHKLTSRKGKEYKQFSHLKASLPPNIILDGELYKHGMPFEDIQSICNPSRVSSHPKEATVEFHCYDLIDTDNLDMPFVERFNAIKHYLPDFYCTRVKSFQGDIRSAEAFLDTFASEGYEGVMIRIPSSPYVVTGTRTPALVKHKAWQTVTLPIRDIVRGDQGTPVAVLQSSFCSIEASQAERESMFQNKADYIGREAQVRFMGYTKDGKIRHGKVKKLVS